MTHPLTPIKLLFMTLIVMARRSALAYLMTAKPIQIL